MQTPLIAQNSSADPSNASDIVIVCGLGSLGQSCVRILKKFGVLVHAIALEMPRWELHGLDRDIDTLVLGDCRQADILQQAGVAQARTILIVTSDEQCISPPFLPPDRKIPTFASSFDRLNKI